MALLSRLAGRRKPPEPAPPWPGALDALPDPYGPDPVVFGAVPRVASVPEVMG